MALELVSIPLNEPDRNERRSTFPKQVPRFFPAPHRNFTNIFPRIEPTGGQQPIVRTSYTAGYLFIQQVTEVGTRNVRASKKEATCSIIARQSMDIRTRWP